MMANPATSTAQRAYFRKQSLKQSLLVSSLWVSLMVTPFGNGPLSLRVSRSRRLEFRWIRYGVQIEDARPVRYILSDR